MREKRGFRVSRGLFVRSLRATLISLLLPMITVLNLTPSARAATPAPTFTFAIAGDYGGLGSGTNGNAVVQKIKNYNPSFAIALGDFGYNDTNPSNWCASFKTIYANVTLITGNHDTKNYGNTFTYNDQGTGTPSDTLTSEDGMGFLDTTSSSGAGYVSACGVPPGLNWVGSSVNQTGATCLSGTLST